MPTPVEGLFEASIQERKAEEGLGVAMLMGKGLTWLDGSPVPP